MCGFITLLTTCGNVTAQEKVTTFGIQFKPIIPSNFFGSGPESLSNGEFTADFKPSFGYNFGMVIRQGLTKRLSMETGINMVQRNYHVGFNHPVLDGTEIMKFRLVGYEIPIQALVYVRLGKQLWMNASGGFSFDMYPSNVKVNSGLFVDTLSVDFDLFTMRRNWIQFALLANYGFEWRTENSGYFYLGASFHRPFTDIGYTAAKVTIDNDPSTLYYGLSGSYLTFDLRYFFHEDPQRKKKIVRKG